MTAHHGFPKECHRGVSHLAHLSVEHISQVGNVLEDSHITANTTAGKQTSVGKGSRAQLATNQALQRRVSGLLDGEGLESDSWQLGQEC